ncbi:MAG: efflux RND transporter permease subunit [Ignavibacteria bacterium]|nr:efflux RND transporter permease subunit [Ignavibacteria bacterium]
MNFFKTIVNNRVTVYILVLIIVVAGAISYINLPREASPSVKIPYVFVSCVYPGVSPEDIENLVTQELEKEIKGISGVKNITSVSRESFCSIAVEFDININIDDAMQKVRDKVSVAKTKLPKDVKEPVITEINLSEWPMLYVNVTGNIGLWKEKEIAEKISDKIEEIPGVLSAEVVGGVEREIKVDVDANLLKHYNLSFSDISNAIEAENLNIPGGKVDIGKSSYLVRVPGEYKDPELIKNILVKKFSNNAIYIRDLANVTYDYGERKTFSRTNGDESITIIVKKKAGANVIEIADNVKALLKDNKDLVPEGVKISYTGDNSKFIVNTVHELENGIITGMILVILVLFFFMGLKNAILVATSIPLSFLISFSVLSMMGITLNMVVLFTLIVVLGIIVDDAIVVIENIYRLQETENIDPFNSSIQGPHQVVFPVIIATLTIISSFFPLLFFPGIVGDFMKYIPITLIICLFSSLFVAMIISPVQASIFIHYKKDREKAAKRKVRPISKFLDFFNRKFFATSLKIYEKVVRKALKYRKTTVVITILLLFFVFILYGILNLGVEFFPKIEPQQVNINIATPVGTNIYTTDEITKLVEQHIPRLKDIEYIVANVGSSNNPLDYTGEGIPNKSTISVNFLDKEEREQNSFISANQIRQSIKGITGAAEVELEEREMGPPVGKPVNIELSGDDLKVLGKYTEEIKSIIKDIPGLSDLKDNYDEAVPEIKVTVDREKAAYYGLSTAMIGNTVRTAINGYIATKYRLRDKEYDIVVRLRKDQRNNVDYLSNLYITDKNGNKIPISSVAKVQFSGGVGAISRKNLKKVVTITGNAVGRLGTEVLKDVKKKLADLKLPDNYSITYTGQEEKQKETSDFLAKAMVISLLMIFFFIVIEFNSIRTPIIIMVSVLLSIIGVMIGLMVTSTPFGIVMTGVGIIALGGIVVRNAILLLDFQKVLVREQNLSRDEALVQAGLIRMRPIFLTAATTILGILPLASGVDFDWRSLSWVIGGQNSAFWRPMGVAIIFGLLFSTFLTLVIIPVIYSLVDDGIKKAFKRKE